MLEEQLDNPKDVQGSLQGISGRKSIETEPKNINHRGVAVPLAVAGVVLVGALVFYEAYHAFCDLAVPAVERFVEEGYAKLVRYHLR